MSKNLNSGIVDLEPPYFNIGPANPEINTYIYDRMGVNGSPEIPGCTITRNGKQYPCIPIYGYFHQGYDEPQGSATSFMQKDFGHSVDTAYNFGWGNSYCFGSSAEDSMKITSTTPYGVTTVSNTIFCHGVLNTIEKNGFSNNDISVPACDGFPQGVEGSGVLGSSYFGELFYGQTPSFTNSKINILIDTTSILVNFTFTSNQSINQPTYFVNLPGPLSYAENNESCCFAKVIQSTPSADNKKIELLCELSINNKLAINNIGGNLNINQDDKAVNNQISFFSIPSANFRIFLKMSAEGRGTSSNTFKINCKINPNWGSNLIAGDVIAITCRQANNVKYATSGNVKTLNKSFMRTTTTALADTGFYYGHIHVFSVKCKVVVIKDDTPFEYMQYFYIVVLSELT